MITHPKSAVAFCPGGDANIQRGAATHLYVYVITGSLNKRIMPECIIQ